MTHDHRQVSTEIGERLHKHALAEPAAGAGLAAGGPSRPPVANFPMEFDWHDGWVPIFDEQVKLVREDIARARADDRVIVYLSCPISSRGGGFAATNVAIAMHTQRRLMRMWGERFWILNPAQYQLESKEGTGLILRHARQRGISEEALALLPRPGGGDYMRMWTQVLVEDGVANEGRFFDAYYFLGPTDVRDFMTSGGALSITAGVEEYFSRQYTLDPDFRDAYSVQDIQWRADPPMTEEQTKLRDKWESRRKEFFCYYAARASTTFSLGAHDEWNIWCLLNQKRLTASKSASLPGGDVGQLLPAYFDDRQVDLSAVMTLTSRGYQTG